MMKKVSATSRTGKPFRKFSAVSNEYQSLVTVAAFPQAVEAHLLRSYLEADGIPCVLGNEYIAATDSPISSVTGGVRVRVRAADVPRAREIIGELEDGPP